ncbi:hypothetical protein L9F63_010687 [Diploptera punctata]|uniref:Cyclic AMP-dependent transcription factor ATF-2 n=1 Tax=Diploptera punctata TaxID=6984 RepID=A0AAD8EQ78_DIPPU|nr:hypothetical protein L9F63_010687 [Diploptera punctata]
MEDDDKPFACSFAGCKMRFTNEDHLTVHKKKHDMVLNFDKGEKANVFVADQTPTPTRFIRNCEEVGLFQDLQNVNPFEETFRKAVEAVKSGTGPLHEVETLTINAGTDDSLHTPHVFPHIIEDSTSSSSSTFKTSTTPVISSTSVIIDGECQCHLVCNDDSTSPTERRELEQLLRPTSTTEDENCPTEVISTSILEERRVISSGNSKVVETRVVRQEADTSQHRVVVTQDSTREIITANTGKQIIGPSNTNTDSAVSAAAGGNNVQLLLRTADGKILQLCALPFEQVTSGVNNNVRISQLQASQPEPVQNTTVVLTTPSITLSEPENNKKDATIKVVPGKQSGGMSLTKLVKLKQALTNIKRTSIHQETSQPKQPIPKNVHVITSSEPKKIIQTSKSSETESPARRMSSSNSEASNNSEDPVEKRRRFLARNRAAAMRCREKRKTWIQELEKRAEDMQRINQQLQSEVSGLRAEVASLKTLLIAHKDCPVTQAMAQGTNVTLAGTTQPSPPQIVVSMPIGPHSQPIVPQPVPQNLIIVNGSTSLKRVVSEPPLTPAKKLLSINSGSPIIRQALLLPSTQGSVQVINNNVVKTNNITNTITQTSINIPAVQPGVLATNPIISFPVTVPGNSLPISAVIQNSNYQEAILPEIENQVVVNDSDKIGCDITTNVIKVNPNVMIKSSDGKPNISLEAEEDSDVEIISDIKSKKR